MFVLPPPPKYPSTVGNGQPILETNNQLHHYEGPEHQLVVGEGTYILRDELHLATPPPHPSEAPVVNPNPLATNLQPPTAGTKLSLAILVPKHTAYQKHARPDTPTSEASGTPSSRGASNPENESSRDSKAGSVAFRGAQTVQSEQPKVPVFGYNNPALTAINGKDAKGTKGGPRKPKNNIIKSNSSYISRVIPHEGLQKRQQDHTPDGIYAFANINRALQWLDLSSPTKVDNLTKILFTKAHALCHDINPATKSSTHLDFVMGSSTGDFIWYEPISQKYARLNKNGVICNSPVSDVKWMPNSENLFLAAHFDGSLVVYDKEKEDAAFHPENETNGHVNGATNGTASGHPLSKVTILKSVSSRNQKTNPVAYWKLSNSKVNAFAFSPSGQYLAVASEDGGLRVLDYFSETLLDVFISYYGGLLSVTWSPDSRYILTGGQDDLVSIWSAEEGTLVARCQGHESWVVDVKFDPWRCDERNYRFGSVGEDCRLLLWDFSVGMLHRPRAASVRQRTSVSSAVPRSRSDAEATRLRSDSSLSNGSGSHGDIVHPVQPRNRTAILPPVMAKQVDDHPLCWLDFEEDCIITSCKEGHIKTWDRPREGTGDALQIAPGTTGNKE